MPELKTTKDSTTLTVKIGLEIHVQLATKSKMFCRCNNEAFQAKPNTTVCPVCLGMPGVLPVANKEAILSTIKTGLALNCAIPKIAKFDRKHYFYPDLPKGYQISQYDEPFATGGWLKLKVESEKSKVNMEEATIRINRVHLEEDAGKLIHDNGKSLVDLNRAGTPLMEIVTEPDITSPKQAGDFLRKLQKIVRDEVGVSEASMEKGHLRCDANISVSEVEKINSASNSASNSAKASLDKKASLDVEPKVLRMSQIVELKNLNSFRFVEKALAIEEEKLKAAYNEWPEKLTKATHGYDSKKNETYVQRVKEEAADYRYFPEPDLPPFDTSAFDLESLKSGLGKSYEARLDEYLSMGIAASDAGVLVSDAKKDNIFMTILKDINKSNASLLAKAIVHRYFDFEFNDSDLDKTKEYAEAIDTLAKGIIAKQSFQEIASHIHDEGITFKSAFGNFSGESEKINLDEIIEAILQENPNEVAAYRSGKTQLLGFFMGQVMQKTKGKADPKAINEILLSKLR